MAHLHSLSLNRDGIAGSGNPVTSRRPASSSPSGEVRTPYHAPLMAKVCHSCGKRPATGNSRSHSMVATRRRFNPNLQKVRIQDGASARR
ncbi:MAG: 50S ribosomal protein L28, partial [Solirubrobacterales bacterium]